MRETGVNTKGKVTSAGDSDRLPVPRREHVERFVLLKCLPLRADIALAEKVLYCQKHSACMPALHALASFTQQNLMPTFDL
jgi:hypothetical protein